MGVAYILKAIAINTSQSAYFEQTMNISRRSFWELLDCAALSIEHEIPRKSKFLERANIIKNIFV